jgi:hypothetical protein
MDLENLASKVSVGEASRRLTVAVGRPVSVDAVKNLICPRETGALRTVGLRSRKRGARGARLIGFPDFVRLGALISFGAGISPELREAVWRTLRAEMVTEIVPQAMRDARDAVHRMGPIASVLREQFPRDWLMRAVRAHLPRGDRHFVYLSVSGRVPLPLPVRGKPPQAGDAGIFLDITVLLVGCLFAWSPGIFDGLEAPHREATADWNAPVGKAS